MKIVLLGAYGSLGKELQKANPGMACPPHSMVDITDYPALQAYLDIHKPDMVINAAAITDNRIMEKDPYQSILVNISGASNVALACLKNSIRLVYISSDYIYKGERGNYSETDEILPYNFYAWTKLGGECSAVGVKNHLIIRCSFGKTQFPYKQAFSDKWTSKDYVDIIAPLIMEAAMSPLTGVLNLGTDRKTLYDYAVVRNAFVKAVKVSDTGFFTPYDSSLNTQKWMDYKGASAIAKPHTICRACGSSDLIKYLDLGLMPLANNLETSGQLAKTKERFPLQVMFCNNCGLSQLSVVIDPGKMFSYYTYRSGINAGYVKHCNEMAWDVMGKYGLGPDSLAVDIAGNDGTLLMEFKKVIGCEVLNVDPASNLVAIAAANGIPSIADFWSLDVAKQIMEKHGGADIITATNVFAHVDDITGFLMSARELLKINGILVLEFPYLIDFIEEMEFDTVYFEHLSYMSVGPLQRLCFLHGLDIIRIEKRQIHGGTIRVTIARADSKFTVDTSVQEFLMNEETRGYKKLPIYLAWASAVKTTIFRFTTEILRLKKEGYRIAGYAASAKGNTLLNSAGINTDIIDFIVDETPEKVGKYSPGTGIPIVYKQELTRQAPDYLIILSWNFKEDIMKKAVEAGYTGKFIIPLPEFKIIEQL